MTYKQAQEARERVRARKHGRKAQEAQQGPAQGDLRQRAMVVFRDLGARWARSDDR